MIRFTHISYLACMLSLLAALGCGGGSKIKLAPVKGKVTVGGSGPFKKGLVRFVPKPGTNLNSREAITDDEGNFVIYFSGSQAGMEPGDYNVGFSLIQLPNGNPLPDQTGEAFPKEPGELGGAQFVPPEFGLASTKNSTTVTEEGGNFEFDIPQLKPQPLRKSGRG